MGNPNVLAALRRNLGNRTPSEAALGPGAVGPMGVAPPTTGPLAPVLGPGGSSMTPYYTKPPVGAPPNPLAGGMTTGQVSAPALPAAAGRVPRAMPVQGRAPVSGFNIGTSLNRPQPYQALGRMLPGRPVGGEAPTGKFGGRAPRGGGPRSGYLF